MSEPGIKYDQGKPDWSLVPFEAMDFIVRGLTHGAMKYSPGNWRYVGWWRYFSAGLRHLWARAKGERIDKDSGLPHLALAGCCVLFMLQKDIDDDSEGSYDDGPGFGQNDPPGDDHSKRPDYPPVG